LCGVLTNPSTAYTPARRFALKVLLQMSQQQPSGLKDKIIFVAHDGRVVRSLLKAVVLDFGSASIIYGTIINLTVVQEAGGRLPFAEILDSTVSSLCSR
jgi:hypothetical protein